MKLRLNRRWKFSYLLTLLLCVLAGCGGGDWSSGDRVLVAKFLYDTGLDRPHRYDVVVFRYPRRPLDKGTPKNYIKRLLGLPGELLAIFFGNLYRCTETVTFDDHKTDPKDLWQHDSMHQDDLKTRNLWDAGKFEILRKAPETIMAMRRPVYDNDHPAADLVQQDKALLAGDPNALPRYQRWLPARESGWKADENHGFHHAGAGPRTDWLRYRHVHRESPGRPQLITDFLGYNAIAVNDQPPTPYNPANYNWVGDLMLDCEVKVEKAQGEFCMELSEGKDRFQACWQLDTGECTLYRLGEDGKRAALKSAKTSVKAPGTYELRFANVDDRLTVWVGRDLPFEHGVAYTAQQTGPVKNDLEPASVGSKGAAVQVHHLRLWRDVYYLMDSRRQQDAVDVGRVDWADPATWDPLRKLDYRTFYVQPRHYFCLGDNSAYSSDSRDWGLVPERLLLGRALMVYYPFSRAGAIQ